MITFRNCILLLILLLNVFLLADEEIGTNPKLAGYPQLSYGNNTGFIFGGILLYRYFPGNTTDPEFRNKLQLQAVYTEKDQFEFSFEPEFNLASGRTRISGEVKFRFWPSEFYGVGDQYICKPEEYTRKGFSLESEIVQKLSDTFYVGLIYDFEQVELSEIGNACTYLNSNIPGSEDYNISGVGFTVIHDVRDSRVYTTQGHFQQLKIVQFDNILGSDFKFTKTFLDLRYFTSISPTQNIAVQSLFEHTNGTAPFLELSQLGNEMRAFETERFIDNNLVFGRIEYRTFPIRVKFFSRFGFALFVESGQVSSSIDGFNVSDMKLGYGGGFRFSVFPDEKYNLRFDLGFSDDQTGINVGFGEAF